ncbi:MAG TPA: Crp/Fnr family transcriptional regulator [Candidatus Fusicatenibacter merdavium]|uniref:Crp/Fnr family transcriptional regulator n=1 Tax=Candidatus Fusicatenibacter merdavium TaxID=2838600 RepID=A0A9D2BIL4_9FIRM|nr:Crp/Fnr family transcriptional regulator [Candidatus Fusicatenibacter merdavium]
MAEQSFNIKNYLEKYYPFWTHLDQREREQLCSCSQLQTCRKGDFLYSNDDDCLGILLVLKGQLRVFIQSGDTREITLFRVGDGQVCTLSASCIIQEITFDIQIEADEDTELIVTNVSCFRTLMQQNVYVENYIYKETTEHFSDVMWAMNQILFSSFDKRLAGYLLDESIRTHSDTLHTTHEQIARNLGSAREVVSRMLKYFEKEGIVSLSRGTVKIIDEKKLKSCIYGEKRSRPL